MSLNLVIIGFEKKNKIYLILFSKNISKTSFSAFVGLFNILTQRKPPRMALL